MKFSDYINELVLYFNIDVTRCNPLIKCLFNCFFFAVLFFIPFLLVHLLYASYLLFCPRRVKDSYDIGASICVSRSFATSNKLTFLEADNVVFFSEKPTKCNASDDLYAVSLRARVSIFFKCIITFFTDYAELSRDVIRYLSPSKLLFVSRFYIMRLPHKVGFSSYLAHLLMRYKPRNLITGNKEDRFALVEQNLAKQLNIPLICYPHGLEYAMKLPRGVVGDVFYCLSDATKEHYDAIYVNSGQEFVFSEKIVLRMLGTQIKSHKSQKKIVFFPESRGIEINQRIIKELLSHNVEFYIKLHPSDSISNYEMLGVSHHCVLDDFDDAISGNLVIARKSTVLLEALYSGSFSCAILIQENDMHFFETEFPSLWDSRIQRAYTFNELINWLNSNADCLS